MTPEDIQDEIRMLEDEAIALEAELSDIDARIRQLEDDLEALECEH